MSCLVIVLLLSQFITIFQNIYVKIDQYEHVDSLLYRFTYGVNPDYRNYQKREFTKYVENSSFFRHLQDEKEIMSSSLKNPYIPPKNCTNKNGRIVKELLQVDFIQFFNQHKSLLFKNCSDFRRFSHCQPHYLFQFDTANHYCHSYFHEKYTHENFTDVTMTLFLSLNRFDRLPYHLNRWKGPMSIAIQINEEELDEMLYEMEKIQRNNIRFTFYIVQKIPVNKPRCSFITMNGKSISLQNCFVCNVLRNLAIETITTSHFLLIDGDGIISSTLESNIQHYIPLLSNENEILLLPIFPYFSNHHEKCIKENDCKEAWDLVPKQKEDLVKRFPTINNIRPGNKIIEYKIWKENNNLTVSYVIPMKVMEPYGIFKRTIHLPLFHPYFMNYGGNKEQYFNVLNTLDYHYNVMTQDFSIDLPHPPYKNQAVNNV